MELCLVENRHIRCMGLTSIYNDPCVDWLSVMENESVTVWRRREGTQIAMDGIIATSSHLNDVSSKVLLMSSGD